MAANARRLLATVGLSSEGEPPSARVGRAITLMLPAGRATLEGVAAAVDTNPRALQRQLAHEGTSFAELLNVGRREFALRYLANSRQSITSIAELTGYATPSGFTRWFAAEFGTSPTAWRVTTFGDGPGVRA
jgi:AraC-like DNA-binding protein